MERFRLESEFDVPVGELFAWHERPGALERLTPPWESMEVVERSGGIGKDARVVLRGRVGPFRTTWEAVHTAFERDVLFRDEMRRGPFATWVHTHRFDALEERRSRLEDSIEYALPFGAPGRLLAGRHARRRIERAFAYRHATLRDDLALVAGRRIGRVAITGSSGLVGSALRALLGTGGNEVVPVPRGDTSAATLAGSDVVVHLAGESIANRRWNAAQKERIRESRTEGTGSLALALASLPRPPRVLVCASAIGYYGDRGEEVVDETSAPGSGFLADVCRQWEGAAGAAVRAGIRVVHLRFGVILSPAGGALAKMLPPFRMGVGGRLGSGRQAMSWISIDDAIGAIHHACVTEGMQGPVNAVAPGALSNAEFTQTLARVLRRPALLPMPALAARLAFGEMAQELLLTGARVKPARLLESGYRFRHPGLEGALRHLLGR